MRASISFVAATAIIGALAGCNGERGTGPGEDDATLVSALAAAQSGGAPAMSETGAVVGLAPLPSGGIRPSTCTFQPASGSYSCPTVTHGGIALTRGFTLLDASGTPRQHFDAQVVAVRYDFLRQGTHRAADVTVTMADTGFSRVTDFRTDAPRIDGVVRGHTTMTGLTGGDATSMEMDRVETIAGLVAPRPPSRYPRAGTVTVEQAMRIMRSGGSTYAAEMTTVFAYDGTPVVTMTLTRGGTTMTCTLDLERRTSTCTLPPPGLPPLVVR